MADQKISQLNNITGANVDDATDELAIVDASANETKAITRGELFKSVSFADFDTGEIHGANIVGDFRTRAEAISNLSNIPTGAYFWIGDLLFRKVASSSVIPDMANVEPAKDDEADARHFGVINTNTTTNDATLAAAFSWLNAADDRILYLPPGNLPIATTRTLRGNRKSVRGRGTLLSRTNSGDFFIFGDATAQATFCDARDIVFQVNGTPGASDKAIRFHRAVDCKIINLNGNVAGAVEWGNATYLCSRCDRVNSHFRIVAAAVPVVNEYDLIQNAANCDVSGIVQQGAAAAIGNTTGAMMRIKPVSGGLVDTIKAAFGYNAQSFTVNSPSASADGIPVGIDIDMTDAPATNIWFDEMSNVDQTTTAAIHIHDGASSASYSRGNFFNLRCTPAAGRTFLIEKSSTNVAAQWEGWTIGGYLPVRGSVESIKITGAGFENCAIEHARISTSEAGSAIARAILLSSDGWAVRSSDIDRNGDPTSRFSAGIEIDNADVTEVYISGNYTSPDIATPVKVPASWTTADKDAPGRIIEYPSQVRPRSLVFYDHKNAIGTITSNTIVGDEYSNIRLSVTGGATVTDITSPLPGLVEYNIVNVGADDITFNNAVGKLRLLGNQNLVLKQHESVTFRRTTSGSVAWQQVGGVCKAINGNFSVYGNSTVTGSLTVGGASVINSDGEFTDLTFDRTTLTIASGAVTATRGFHAIDTEGAAASDNLDTINGGSLGQILIVTAADSARTVIVKDGTGNLNISGDCTLDNSADTLTLICLGASWAEISRSDNAA